VNKKIIVTISIVAILIVIATIFLNVRPPYCDPNQVYTKISETVGTLLGGYCYCPTDKITPFGYPEADWSQVGDYWQCNYIL